jgi:release factor glutamine methyltransferase
MMQNNNNPDLPEEYADGFATFLDCRIDLSRRVLIPRPETEFWTEIAIGDLAKSGSARVLDIFSGSGCVGIAIAKKLPQIAVDFCDIDARAIEQIKINLKINNIDARRARIFESNIFENLPPKEYDAILANPPYIDPARIAEVQKSVLDYEPAVALFSDKRGLDIAEKFLKTAKNFLTPDGFIYLEFDPSQAGAVEKIIRAENYSSFEILKDQYGELRVAKIVK